LKALMQEQEQRIERGSYSDRRKRSMLSRMREYFVGKLQGERIQRCAFIPAPKPRRSGQRINPNPAPCGGRLYRSGGLLTCRLCGRNAQG
jgi:hypothetical protein